MKSEIPLQIAQNQNILIEMQKIKKKKYKYIKFIHIKHLVEHQLK